MFIPEFTKASTDIIFDMEPHPGKAEIEESREERRDYWRKLSRGDIKLTPEKAQELRNANDGKEIKSNLFKILALNKIKIKDEEVSLLGILHNTMQATVRGEEAINLRKQYMSNCWYDVFNIPGQVSTFLLDVINTVDKKILFGIINKALEPLIPEKYKDPNNQHIEFMRQGGFFTD